MENKKSKPGKVKDYVIEMKSSLEEITHEEIRNYAVDKAKQKIEKRIGESGRELIEITIPGEIEYGEIEIPIPGEIGYGYKRRSKYIKFFVLAGTVPRGFIILNIKHGIVKILDERFNPIYTFNRIYDSNGTLGNVARKIWVKRFAYESEFMRKTGNRDLKDINYNETP